jgi:hypothetical protein
MARLAEPGGVVALEDVDIDSWNCEPPHPAWERLLAAVETVYARDGKDLRIGRRLPGLLRAAGLANVGCKPHARVNGPGDFHQQQLLIFVKMFWRRIVELGLVAEPKLKLLFMDLEAHLAQPGTMVISPTLFQAWGEKPRGSAPKATELLRRREMQQCVTSGREPSWRSCGATLYLTRFHSIWA